jgi:hypothetical protein
MKRNEAATCGNCPYYDTTGYCRRVPSCESKHGLSWCGQHPDFAASEPAAKRTCVTCQNYEIDERDGEWCNRFAVPLGAEQTKRGLVCALWMKWEAD